MPGHSLATSTAYLQGQFVPFAEANLSIASSPVLYGLAVYTVFSANFNPNHNQSYVFRLRDHYQRLVGSARIMDFADFSKALSYDAFEEIILELLRKNAARENVLIRAMIYVDELAAGTRIRGLKNDLAIFVYPLGEILPRSGAHVCVSSWNRLSDNMIPARAKINGSYVNACLIKNEALMNGYDDALALDTSGHVTEGTMANFFMVKHGQLITPGAQSDILEGITRDTILKLAADLEIPATERPIDRSELYTADEAMLVGSSAQITPILSIDHRPIGNGTPGPITSRLTKQYRDLQMGLLRKDFLTSVYN